MNRPAGIGAERPRRPKKGKAVQLLEYALVVVSLLLVRFVPLGLLGVLGRLLGIGLYHLFPERRRVALDNIRHALGQEKGEEEIQAIARKSCQSFFLALLESIKFHSLFRDEDARGAIRNQSGEIEALFEKARRIHEESGGCIFVTPHIGNWEFLPHVSALVGIPLVVVARPLGNLYLEKLIYSRRTESGQVIIPKKNAFYTLQKTLQQGKSIGMLPDQSARQGISVDFFGRKASTTPAPAILSIQYQRPIVVVACCRKENGNGYEGVVSEPIWPGTFRSEKEEIFRLTEEMNRRMESIIRRYPQQYFWIHNRWKIHRSHRELLR